MMDVRTILLLAGAVILAAFIGPKILLPLGEAISTIMRELTRAYPLPMFIALAVLSVSMIVWGLKKS